MTINMPISLEYHPFEPAEPEAAPAENIMHKSFDYQADPATSGKVTELVSDNGPRVDTRRLPPAHYFCAKCGKTTELCHHFSTAQAVDTGTISPYPCQGLKNCDTKKECLTAVRCLKNLPEATTQATEARPEINTVGFKPLLSEAAAQKVEQPAVEPQCNVCTKTVEQIFATGIGIAGAWDETGKIWNCSYCLAGSTRPEMPPKLSPAEWNLFHKLWTKAVGTENYDKQEWVKFENLLVQQEPLSAQEIWNRLPAIHIEQEGEVALIQRVLDLLKPQPLAPRTESRGAVIGMYLSLERYNELIGRENVLLASEHKNVLLLAADIEDELHEIARLIGTDDRSNVINAVKNSLAQARTQPAPRTPACPECGHGVTLDYDDINGFNVQCGEHGEHYWDALCFQELDKFFTALPEATKEEK